MDPVQHFWYKLFCINFCNSTATRRWILLLHFSIVVATLLFVHFNHDVAFTVSQSVADKTSSVAIHVWFLCYISVYIVIIVEGFLKDAELSVQYNSVIKRICQKHCRRGRDYYTLVIYALLFFDLLYFVLCYIANSYFQYLHNSCIIPKIVIRLRVWSYFYLARNILLELEELIGKVKRTLQGTAAREELFKLQREFLDLWMISQRIGDFYVWSLCCVVLYIFFDMIVYFFWFFTIDFADERYIFCEYWE